MLNLPLSLLLFLLSVPCIGKLKEPMPSCYIQHLLKQNFNKACPEDEAMPLVCLFSPNCADRAAVVSVVSVLVWTCNQQRTQPGPRLNYCSLDGGETDTLGGFLNSFTKKVRTGIFAACREKGRSVGPTTAPEKLQTPLAVLARASGGRGAFQDFRDAR